MVFQNCTPHSCKIAFRSIWYFSCLAKPDFARFDAPCSYAGRDDFYVVPDRQDLIYNPPFSNYLEQG